VGGDDAGDGVALDELALLAGGVAKGGVGEAVGVAHGAKGGLVDHGDGVGSEELAVTADASEAHAHVLGGVGWREGVDAKATMETEKERAIASHAKPIEEVGQTDEDEREERATVPLVIEQDVEVVERVLVEELSLVEQETG
jgi:hypothetical protein